jgi:predicted transcriptional regulator
MSEKESNLNSDLHEFAFKLSEAVAETGLTPYGLAKNIGVDKQVISRLIKGNYDPKFSTVIRIVKSMNISMDGLLGICHSQNSVEPTQISEEVEVKTADIDFINSISKMHEQDIELLASIGEILNERRVQRMAKLVNAVLDVKQINKESLMIEAVATPKLSDDFKEDDYDDYDDNDFDEDNDFDDEDYEDEDTDDDDFDDDYDEDDFNDD